MKKILIIDDDRGVRQYLLHALNKKYVAIESSGEGDLLKLIIEENPNLILLDLNMPNIDGRDLCQTLKTMGLTKEIPIAIISGMPEDYNREVCFELGAVSYVPKPILVSHLYKIIDSIIGDRNVKNYRQRKTIFI